MKILGFILFPFAISFAIWIKKRSFNRTNKYGIEEFDNVYSKVLMPHIEKMLWYLAMGFIFLSVVFICC